MQRPFALSSILFGLIVSIYILTRSSQPKIAALKSSETEKALDFARSDKDFRRPQIALKAEEQKLVSDERRTQSRIPTSQREKKEKTSESTPSIDPQTLDSVSRSLDELNLYNWLDFQSKLNKLRQMDPAELGQALNQLFQQIEPSQMDRRDLIIEVAKNLNSPHTFPLWNDVISRRTERFENEAARRAENTHLNMVDRMVTAEQHIALRELSQIAPKSPAARELLWDVVIGKIATADRLATRRRAFVVLHEINPTITLRLGASLDQDDPLREQIKTILKR